MVNYFAVLLAGIVTFVLGALWYSPVMFGKEWMKLADVKKAKNNPAHFIGGFVSTLVMIYIFAYIMEMFVITTILSGVTFGLLVWLGFVGTITFGSVLWERKPWKLYLLNNAYHLISFAIIGAILAAY